jgi:hypothetical protein
MPVIPAMKEAEMEGWWVRSQPWAKSMRPLKNKLKQKSRLGVWLKWYTTL